MEWSVAGFTSSSLPGCATIGETEVSRASQPDPYRTVIQQFNRRGVRYVVVGMSGINYYASSAAETFATMDYDLFLDPSLKNVEQAVRLLRKLGFTLGTSTDVFQQKNLRQIVRDRRTLVATTSEGIMVELLLEISGYQFSDLARDAATVTIRGVSVKVGRLSKLLRSKQLAGRSKDRQFLRRYQSLLEEEKK